MPKLYRNTQEEAQLVADSCHSYLVDNDEGYAYSVTSGQTVRWSNVIQEGSTDENGVFTPSSPEQWYIIVTEQVKLALSQEDQDLLFPQVIENASI